MAAQQLQGKKVAILATDGVERVELTEPRKALDAAGARTVVVSPKSGSIKGWEHDHWGDSITVDQSLDDARADQFDALMLPGGVMNPDHLRQNERAVQFVRSFFRLSVGHRLSLVGRGEDDGFSPGADDLGVARDDRQRRRRDVDADPATREALYR